MKVKSKIKINFQGKSQKAKGKNMRLFNGSQFGLGRAIFAFLLLPFTFSTSTRPLTQTVLTLTPAFPEKHGFDGFKNDYQIEREALIFDVIQIVL